MDTIIEASHITKQFATVTALKDISLTVRKGETFGLLGPNGAGKTTLVRILCGVLSPTSGSARVLGHDLFSEKNEIKRKTGLLPEHPGTYEDLTAKEFLSFVGELYGLAPERRVSRTADLLSLFDLSDRGDDLIAGFSSGMRQKVMLASMLGGVLLSWMTGERLPVALALSTGFGWFSLSGALAGQHLGDAYGSVALLTDLMRELIGLTVVFLLGHNFANSSIGVCGATAMDTTLPFVRQACHYEYVPTAIISGLILTIAAPFFMLFFLSLV